MSCLLAFFSLALLSIGWSDEADHTRNPVYSAVRAEGLSHGGVTYRLPEPTFCEGQTAAEQRAALRDLAGSDRAVEGLMRDSVTAPFILKLQDTPAEDATIRAGSLYFVLHLDLDNSELPESYRATLEGPVEAGNMRFESRVLDESEIDAGPREDDDAETRFVHVTGRLLDRILVRNTQRHTISRTEDSVVFASRTDRRFDDDDRWPNLWRPIDRTGDPQKEGPPRAYPGSLSYAKLTTLQDAPGTVVVEAHFALVEPDDWFNGAPILRSKFSLIAQDQIRRLRRELAR